MRKLILKNREVLSVCVKTGETAAEQYAAQELKNYMEKIDIPEGDGAIFVLSLDPSVGRDGYRIDVSEDGIAIAGGNGRGVIYGVYAFFEKYAGVRYFMPGLETLGDGDIVVEEGCSYVPVFEFRQSDWSCGRDADWSVKNGVNDYAKIPAEKGGSVQYGFFVHSMNYLTGADQWKEQPCLSDPENLKKAIAGVRKILAEKPDANIISVSQNDNQNYCKCEKCAAVDAEEGSPAGILLRFVNAVAEDIAKDYPDVIIDTLAYQYTRKAPKITKPLPNVCVRLCSIECCFSHPLDDASCPQNIAFRKDIEDWYKLCDRIYIWDYVTNFPYYIPTFPNFHTLRQNMRFYADHGVRGMYPEGNYNGGQSGEFGELRCYLLAKLMWNPYMSETEYYGYMDEFLAAYYGEGWRYIRAYIDFACMEAAAGHMSIWVPPFAIIPAHKWEAMLETCDLWWDKAEELAGDRLAYVQRSRLQWRYIRLALQPDAEEGRKFAEDVETANVKWSEGGQVRPEPEKLHLPPTEWFR